MTRVVRRAIFFMPFIVMIAGCLVFAQQDYPKQTITIICPMAAGGSSDLSARVVAEKMAKELGKPIIVVNKPGAGGTLGTNFVAKSKPDGYTVLTVPSSWILVPMVMPNVPYKVSDFVPIGRLAGISRVIVVHKDLPVKNLKELVDYAKKYPKTISYAGAQLGGVHHIVGEVINLTHGLDLQFIPYSGEAPAVTALLGNHVQMGILGLPAALPRIKTSAVRALAVLDTKRDPTIPDVPTCVEQGFPDLVSPSYHTFFMPAKTPPVIVKKLEAELEKALKDKEVQDKIEKMELYVDFLNSRDSQAAIDAELNKWGPIVKKLNIVVK